MDNYDYNDENEFDPVPSDVQDRVVEKLKETINLVLSGGYLLLPELGIVQINHPLKEMKLIVKKENDLDVDISIIYNMFDKLGYSFIESEDAAYSLEEAVVNVFKNYKENRIPEFLDCLKELHGCSVETIEDLIKQNNLKLPINPIALDGVRIDKYGRSTLSIFDSFALDNEQPVSFLILSSFKDTIFNDKDLPEEALQIFISRESLIDSFRFFKERDNAKIKILGQQINSQKETKDGLFIFERKGDHIEISFDGYISVYKTENYFKSLEDLYPDLLKLIEE